MAPLVAASASPLVAPPVDTCVTSLDRGSTFQRTSPGYEVAQTPPAPAATAVGSFPIENLPRTFPLSASTRMSCPCTCGEPAIEEEAPPREPSDALGVTSPPAPELAGVPRASIPAATAATTTTATPARSRGRGYR